MGNWAKRTATVRAARGPASSLASVLLLVTVALVAATAGGRVDQAGAGAAAGTAQSYPLDAEAMRRGAFRSCLGKAARHTRAETRRARRLSRRRRARARRHIKRHRARLRRLCVRRHGRTPGRVTDLSARAASRRRIVLTFSATGTDGDKPPAARTYVVKQSRRPIRGARGFRRAQSLCRRGRCRFAGVTDVGAKLTLTISDLRRRTRYRYAVAARDNVTGRLGPRSRAVTVRTR